MSISDAGNTGTPRFMMLHVLRAPSLVSEVSSTGYQWQIAFPGQRLLSPELYPLLQWRQSQGGVMASLRRESTMFKPLLPSLRYRAENFPPILRSCLLPDNPIQVSFPRVSNCRFVPELPRMWSSPVVIQFAFMGKDRKDL